MSSTYTVSNAELVVAARNGDERAWEQIVERYQPLINAVARRHRLSGSDASDVSQQVWMKLVENADRLREPEALPGWIATTAARACQELLRKQKRSISVDPLSPNGMDSAGSAGAWPRWEDCTGVDDGLLRAEQRHAVREGLLELTDAQQQLLLLLVADPPVPYAEISERMGMAMGSIGPTRARLLTKLERTVAVRQFTADRSSTSLIAA